MINDFESKIVANLPDRDYRADPSISQSTMRNYSLMPSCWHFYKRYVSPNRPVTSQTAAMEIGTIFHARIENKSKEAFEKTYQKIPKGIKKGTKAYKELEAEAVADGKEPLKHEVWDLTEAMFESVMSVSLLSHLVKTGIAEESFFSTYKGIPIKGRTDLRCPNQKLIIDFKTCENANPLDTSFRSFAHTVSSSKLDWQAAFYSDQISKITGDKYDFIFVCVEKKFPFATSLITISSQDMERAKNEVYQALEDLNEKMQSGNWGSGYGNKVHEIQIRRSVYAS